MDAFESLVSMLLQRDGYWTRTSFKVDLTKSEKRRIGRPTCPRWEIDIVAYKAATNEILAVECKSFLDSTGVIFRKERFETASRYKLFTDSTLRRTVLGRLAKQLLREGACCSRPKVILGLATGKIAQTTDRGGLERIFSRRKWRLLDDKWIVERLRHTSATGYEDDVGHLVTKILLRH